MTDTSSVEILQSGSLNFSAANLMGGLIFGGIGLVAFVYGKKQSDFKALLIGITLMIFPYFVTNSWLLYGIGIVLTVLLFLFN